MSARAIQCACGAFFLTLALVGPGWAQTAGPSPAPDHMPSPGMTGPEMAGRASQRFPQPVRVGDLTGRFLLQPEESQPVLGCVTGLARRSDGATDVIIQLDGSLGLGWLGLQQVAWAGFGSRLVAVPVEAVGLLGEYVALMGMTPESLRALPTFAPGSATSIPPDETLRIGIVRPFH